MRSTDRKIEFRCIAYPGENNGRSGYYAVCIDLTLVTWRPTLSSAKSSLNSAIEGYFEAAFAAGQPVTKEQFRKLCHRPAPFWPYKFHYHFGGIVNLFTRNNQILKFRNSEHSPIFNPA